MVVADVTGTGQLKKIKLDPSVVNPADIEMLEDLVTVAVSDAQTKAQSRRSRWRRSPRSICRSLPLLMTIATSHREPDSWQAAG